MIRRFRKLKSPAVAVERQKSVEHLDTLAYMEDEDRATSTPDLSGEPVAMKTKKRKHFHVFHRRHHHKSKKNHIDDRLSESLHAQSLSPGPELLSLGHSWSPGTWNSAKHRGSSSIHSSATSLESREPFSPAPSEEEEIVESLINPSRRESSQNRESASGSPVS